MTTAPAASSRARWSSSPCGSPAAPHERDDHVQVVARAEGGLDRRRQVGGRVRVGAVAEHDVEQQHGHRVVLRRGGELLDPQRRIDHRVSAALGVLVVAEVGELAAPHDRRRLGAERAAAVEAAHAPGRRRAAERSGVLGQRSRGLPRRLHERRAEGEDHRLARGRRRLLDVIGHGRVGRLGDDDDHARVLVGGQQLERRPRHQPADLGAQVAAADADRVRDAHPGGVEQAAHLLDAGPGRADDPDRPAPDRVREPERDAVDDRGAAVGAHEQQVALDRPPLQRTSTSRLTPSEKQNTCRPASSAAAAS